jgi:inositol oxygenase
MALVGLLHGLGKLLGHPRWGTQPQWAIAGETYPLGCRFALQIRHAEFFSANPDRCEIWYCLLSPALPRLSSLLLLLLPPPRRRHVMQHPAPTCRSRRRAFNTPLGIYSPRCGLANVFMSWSAAEYLYLVLVLNQTCLPPEALFVLRHQRSFALTRQGGAYRQLMSDADAAALPLLADFQQLLAYRRVVLPPDALTGHALREHYDRLIETYLGSEPLFW